MSNLFNYTHFTYIVRTIKNTNDSNKTKSDFKWSLEMKVLRPINDRKYEENI